MMLSIKSEHDIEEVWKDIPNYEGIYQASSRGQIRSRDRKVWNYLKKGRILKPYISTSGYYCLSLSGKKHYVHRVIATTFLGKMPNKIEVNHIDSNRLNNRIENLEWVTRTENVRHFMGNNDMRNVYIQRSIKTKRKMKEKKDAAKETVKYLYYAEGYSIRDISKIITLGKDVISTIVSEIREEENIPSWTNGNCFGSLSPNNTSQ